jgi:hypothetical protein
MNNPTTKQNKNKTNKNTKKRNKHNDRKQAITVTEVTTEKHGGGLGRGKGELQVANMV